MFGLLGRRSAPAREEAEKPFWISYSDLMTALMVLFLVAMAVALLAVTNGLAKIEQAKRDRQATIAACMNTIENLTHDSRFHGVEVTDHTIKFGTLAEFALAKNSLNVAQAHFLRSFVPNVLSISRQPTCDKWLKRVVVDGFASQEGSYLFNLNLSFQRSQRILCVLLDPKAVDGLSQADRRLIRTLFVASGSSFNAVKKSPVESRRVELTVEFRELESKKIALPNIPWDDDSRCPSDYY